MYNFLGRDFFNRLVSDLKVPAGDVSLRYELEPTGKPDFAAGKGVPAIWPALHRREVGGRRRHAAHGAEHLQHRGTHLRSCGGGSRVAPEHYQDSFAFTRTLNGLGTIDLSGDLIVDSDTDMKVRHGAPVRSRTRTYRCWWRRMLTVSRIWCRCGTADDGVPPYLQGRSTSASSPCWHA